MPRLLHASHSHLFVGARLWPDLDEDAPHVVTPDNTDRHLDQLRGTETGSDMPEDRVVFSDGSSAEATLHSAEGKTQRLDVASYETQAGTVVAAKSWFCDERADAASGSAILLVTERAG